MSNNTITPPLAEQSVPRTTTLYNGDVVDTPRCELVELFDGDFALIVDPDLVTLFDDTFAIDSIDGHHEVIKLHDSTYAVQNHHDTVTLHNGEYALDDDCRYCQGLDEYYLSEECERWRGDWYSDEYLRENTFVCDSCGDRYHNDDYASDDLCSYCYSSDDDDSDDDECDNGRDPYRIRSYSDRAANHFTPEGKGPLFFGIELEVEAKNGDPIMQARLAYEQLGLDYVTMKSDGSLSDSGFEIVTRPDTAEVHKRKFAKFLETASKTLTSWNNGRCGMHIHATRDAMSQLQLGKLLVWLNHEANVPIIKLIAGRSLDRWAKTEYGKKASDAKKFSHDRYVTLNVSGPTAELRIFRGTLKPESFLKNIEFYEALIEFTAPAKHRLSDMEQPQPFFNFIVTNAKKYPNLHAFCTRRRIYAAVGVQVTVEAPTI
jgi:hypothetical protein